MKLFTWICISFIAVALPIQAKSHMRSLTNASSSHDDEINVWTYGYDHNDTEDSGDDVQDIPRYDVEEEHESDVTFLGYAPGFQEDDDDDSNLDIMDGDKRSGRGDDEDTYEPRRPQRKGRKHCHRSRLYCANNGRCCTHVTQGEVWCCSRKARCGKVPNTCRRRS
jgi:hypothetical protein